jgi:hypothetical protein
VAATEPCWARAGQHLLRLPATLRAAAARVGAEDGAFAPVGDILPMFESATGIKVEF